MRTRLEFALQYTTYLVFFLIWYKHALLVSKNSLIAQLGTLINYSFHLFYFYNLFCDSSSSFDANRAATNNRHTTSVLFSFVNKLYLQYIYSNYALSTSAIYLLTSHSLGTVPTVKPVVTAPYQNHRHASNQLNQIHLFFIVSPCTLIH